MASAAPAAKRRGVNPQGIAARLAFAVSSALLAEGALAEFLSEPVTTAHVGRAYVYDVVATGAGDVRITAPNGLPSWLALAETGNGTATLSGTPGPGDAGEGIVLRSEDSVCQLFLVFCFRYQTFDITIVPNRPPGVIPPGIDDQSAVEGEAFRLDVSHAFDDPDGDALAFTATGLPGSLSLSGTVISGTPIQADAHGSPFEVSITADDGRGGRVSDAFTLGIAARERTDLSLQATASGPALRGEPFELDFVIANAGPDPSGSIELAVELAGIPVALAGHACTQHAVGERQKLICGFEPIPAGQSAAFSLAGSASEVGDVFLTAVVMPIGAEPIDPEGANNAATAVLNVGGVLSAEPAQRLSGAARAVAGGDLNGDGFDDLAVTAGEEAPPVLHLNLENPAGLHEALMGELDERRGLSTASLALEGEPAGNDVAFEDLNGDGDLDVVVASGAGTASAVFLNDGAGAMSLSASIAATADTRAVALGDVDGDGRVDVVLANAGANAVYLNRGGGTLLAATLDEARSSVDAAIVDLDLDGFADLVFANEDGDATLHRGSGGGFGEAVPIATGATSSVARADFNGDGYMDLVFGRLIASPEEPPSNPVLLNDGAGGFIAADMLGASPTVDVLVADFDEDAAPDVVAINLAGVHQLFLGEGDGRFLLHPTLLVSHGASAGAAARIGRMKSIDLVVAGTKGVEVFFNDSRGRLGLGDTGPPVIELIGPAEIRLEVEDGYEDPGASVADDVDEALDVAVDNPVDTKIIGRYTVTYSAVDSAGNAAVPVTRTVHVEARRASGGGGGGAPGGVLTALLLAGLALRRFGALRGLERARGAG